ncbi:MAG: tRNA 2-thiouridine synthesizing protein A [Paracoccaceae bacterium]|jgi:tRNA 2-thiouridine synthesizing protein A
MPDTRESPETQPETDRETHGDPGPGAPLQVDARGLLCPLPVLRARKRIKALPEGALIELIADDPAAAVDVPHFCAEQGHTLVQTTRTEGPERRFVIRRGPGRG